MSSEYESVHTPPPDPENRDPKLGVVVNPWIDPGEQQAVHTKTADYYVLYRPPPALRHEVVIASAVVVKHPTEELFKPGLYLPTKYRVWRTVVSKHSPWLDNHREAYLQAVRLMQRFSADVFAILDRNIEWGEEPPPSAIIPE